MVVTAMWLLACIGCAAAGYTVGMFVANYKACKAIDEMMRELERRRDG